MEPQETTGVGIAMVSMGTKRLQVQELDWLQWEQKALVAMGPDYTAVGTEGSSITPMLKLLYYQSQLTGVAMEICYINL